MGSKVTVVIATFGDLKWADRAEKAATSVPDEVPIVLNHGHSLHEARNDGLSLVETEYVIFLDADDELAPNYVETMSEASDRFPNVDVFVPALKYDFMSDPQVPRVGGHGDHNCLGPCLVDGNYVCIGAMAKVEKLSNVRGFREFERYEDWDLWLRVHLAGGLFMSVRKAIYLAHSTVDGRNVTDLDTALRCHEAVLKANGLR